MAARDFNGSSASITPTGLNIDALGQFSFFCWARPESLGDRAVMFSTGATFANGVALFIENGSSDWWWWYRRSSTTFVQSISTVTTGQWYALLGTISASVNQEFYVNGVSQGTDTPGTAQIATDQVLYGVSPHATDKRWFDGQLAWLTWWNVVLTAKEASALASGVRPTRIRPKSIISCTPAWGVHATETDLRKDYPGTVANATAYTEGPPVMPYRATRRQSYSSIVVAPGGVSIPVIQHHRKQQAA